MELKKDNEQNTETHDRLFRIIVVGDRRCGKTSFINRFVDLPLTEDYTIHDYDFKEKIIVDPDTNKKFQIQLWDMTSVIQNKVVSSPWWYSANGAIFMVDVTERKSFDKLSDWLDKIHHYAAAATKIIVVASKCDNKENRKVFNEEILDLIGQLTTKPQFSERNLEFMEVSSHEDKNILAAVTLLSKNIENLFLQVEAHRIREAELHLYNQSLCNRNITPNKKRDCILS